jgi:hypothetical protein
MVFDDVFGILLLLTRKNVIFWRKKKHAPQMSPNCHKKFSAQKNKVSIFARGKTLVIFGSCEPHISKRKLLGILSLWQLLLYLSRCNSPESFTNFR